MILLRTNFAEDVVEWTIIQHGLPAAYVHKAGARPVVPKSPEIPQPHVKGSPDSDVQDV